MIICCTNTFTQNHSGQFPINYINSVILEYHSILYLSRIRTSDKVVCCFENWNSNKVGVCCFPSLLVFLGFGHNVLTLQVITPCRKLILCADNRKEMEDWIAALKTVQNREHFEVMLDKNIDLFLTLSPLYCLFIFFPYLNYEMAFLHLGFSVFNNLCIDTKLDS